MSVTPLVPATVLLACRNPRNNPACLGSITVDGNTVVGNKPVLQWWRVDRGELCRACFNAPDVGYFVGAVYVPALDEKRLTGQLLRVYDAMKDGAWRTLPEIRAITGDSLDASISKQLRHLRMKRFGSYQVDKRHRGSPTAGLWEYRLGAKGSGDPQRDPKTVRAELAETRLALALEAIRAFDPNHPVLAEIDP